MKKHGKTWDKFEEALYGSNNQLSNFLQSSSGLRSSTCSIKENPRKHQSRSLSFQKDSCNFLSRPRTASTVRKDFQVLPQKSLKISQDDFSNLFKAKCYDLGISETEDQEKRFFNYCASNLKDRKLNLTGLGLGSNTANILGTILSENRNFCSLLLSKNHLKDEGALSLMRSLKSSLCISHLDLSSNDISERGMESCLKELVFNESISSLDLASKGQIHRNRLGTHGCKSLSLLLKQSKILAILNLSSTGVTSEGLDFLISGLDQNTYLTSLDFSGNSLGAKGVEKLSKVLSTTEVKYLNLSFNKLGDEGADYVSVFLSFGFGQYCPVTRLALCENSISSKGASFLFKSLKNNSILESLDLSKNNLSKGLSHEFLEFLYENASLKRLVLSSCLLHRQSLAGISEGLSRNFGLEELDFSNNFIQDSGCEDIAVGLNKNQVLKSLILTNNKIRSKGAITLIKSINHHKTLETLSLKQNLIQDDFGRVLNEIIRKKNTLLAVDLDFNPISVKVYREIKEKARNNCKLKKKQEVPALKQAINKIYSDNSVLENIHFKLMSLNKEKNSVQEKVSEKGFKLKHLKELEQQQMMELLDEQNKLKNKKTLLVAEMDELNSLIYVKIT
jgi:Ran GTPase-activating protein (RanGAP) involved in mRNA processing and transport